MHPRDIPSAWVKLRPWYYTRRTQPSRREEERRTIRESCEENDYVPPR